MVAGRADTDTNGMSHGRSVSLLDVDRELAAAIPESDLPAAARAAHAPVVTLPAGPTHALEQLSRAEGVLGFYVVSGVLLRELSLPPVALPELLGPGEVVPPAGEAPTLFVAEVTDLAIEPVELLVLGPPVARTAGRWPTLLAAIERRKAAQHSRTDVLRAIGQLPRVELRLLCVLWHLAEVWGRVGRDGTVVPFPLTHEVLGRFVSARRPTVSLAVADMTRAGLVRRNDDGTWLLPAGSAEALEELLAAEARLPPLKLRARVARGASRRLVEASQLTSAEVADGLEQQLGRAAGQSAQAPRHRDALRSG